MNEWYENINSEKWKHYDHEIKFINNKEYLFQKVNFKIDRKLINDMKKYNDKYAKSSDEDKKNMRFVNKVYDNYYKIYLVADQENFIVSFTGNSVKHAVKMTIQRWLRGENNIFNNIFENIEGLNVSLLEIIYSDGKLPIKFVKEKKENHIEYYLKKLKNMNKLFDIFLRLYNDNNNLIENDSPFYSYIFKIESKNNVYFGYFYDRKMSTKNITFETIEKLIDIKDDYINKMKKSKLEVVKKLKNVNIHDLRTILHCDQLLLEYCADNSLDVTNTWNEKHYFYKSDIGFYSKKNLGKLNKYVFYNCQIRDLFILRNKCTVTRIDIRSYIYSVKSDNETFVTMVQLHHPYDNDNRNLFRILLSYYFKFLGKLSGNNLTKIVDEIKKYDDEFYERNTKQRSFKKLENILENTQIGCLKIKILAKEIVDPENSNSFSSIKIYDKSDRINNYIYECMESEDLKSVNFKKRNTHMVDLLSLYKYKYQR